MMWRYKTQEHRMVGDVLYHLAFGQMPHVGILSLHLSATVLDTLATEFQLNQVCDYVRKVDIPANHDAVAVGKDVEDVAKAIDDPIVVGKDEGEEAVANNILRPEITAGYPLLRCSQKQLILTKNLSRATPTTLMTMTTAVKGKEFQWLKL